MSVWVSNNAQYSHGNARNNNDRQQNIDLEPPS